MGVRCSVEVDHQETNGFHLMYYQCTQNIRKRIIQPFHAQTLCMARELGCVDDQSLSTEINRNSVPPFGSRVSDNTSHVRVC
jgi:hypothetical protein